MISAYKPHIIIIILTLVTAIIVKTVHNSAPIKNQKLFDFPAIIEKWEGIKIPMEDWVFKSLETPYSILRDYTSPEGEKINLAIVWYDDREIAFHGAAACLGGAGNKVTEMNLYKFNIDKDHNFNIGKLVTNKSNLQRLVLYYYISDGFLTADQIELRKHILFKRLKFKRTSAAFIRIMMPVTKNKETTRNKLEAFVKATLPFVVEYTDTKQVSGYSPPMLKDMQ